MASSTQKSSGAAIPSASDAFSSQQSHDVWLAGLGALARAQAEGGKAFEALVKQGVELQRQAQALAKEQLADATQRMGAMATSPTNAGHWNALEDIFERRVARAITRLGFPDADALAKLEARIAALEQALAAKSNYARKRASPTKPSAKKTTRD